MESIFANYFSAISVIIVYHLLLLQHWLDRVSDLESDAEQVLRETAAGDLARERMRRLCRNRQKDFPWLQVVTLFIAVSFLSVLSIAASHELKNIKAIYSVGPVYLLWGVFASATFGAWWQGRRRLTRLGARL
jgi:hypothetical protein